MRRALIVGLLVLLSACSAGDRGASQPSVAKLVLDDAPPGYRLEDRMSGVISEKFVWPFDAEAYQTWKPSFAFWRDRFVEHHLAGGFHRIWQKSDGTSTNAAVFEFPAPADADAIMREVLGPSPDPTLLPEIPRAWSGKTGESGVFWFAVGRRVAVVTGPLQLAKARAIQQHKRLGY